MLYNKEPTDWGSYAIYLYDEFGDRPDCAQLRDALEDVENFNAGANTLAYEAHLLCNDIKEDYFRSPNTCIPAPWIFNSPELFILFFHDEKEEGIRIPFHDHFFRAVVRDDFGSSFEEFFLKCYPEIKDDSWLINFQTYNQFVGKSRNTNQGAWDNLLEHDPKFFYEYIRPKLKKYVKFFIWFQVFDLESRREASPLLTRNV